MKRLFFTLAFFWQRKFFYLRLLLLPLPKTKVRFDYTLGQYIIKTAQTRQEVWSVLKMRYHVFFQEFSGIHPLPIIPPWDVDQHDFLCDHLLVVERASQEIVATYRLRCDGDHPFYTEGEFNLAGFKKLAGKKLELGRACVIPKARQGVAVRLLWRGLCEYLARSGARYMFGCSSLTRNEMGDWNGLLAAAQEQNAVLPHGLAIPRAEFSLDHFPEVKALCATTHSLHHKTTSLLHMYLAAGAKISEGLAYDQEMDCVDIFTLLDFNHITPMFNRRLGADSP